jgi:cyclic pyranopterin phosphate synthase
MRDSLGRRIDYLRLSVTDRCGLRCQYCLPGDPGSPVLVGQAPLLAEEIVRIVSVLRGLGLTRVRLTGGEPLTRPGLTGLTAALASLGLDELAMTTNGQGLARLAHPLARAGLRRVNVSLDALDESRYREITRVGRIGPVLQGLEAALEAGLHPVKLNVVVARGTNEDQIPAFVDLAMERPIHVRFIELMPLGDASFYTEGRRVPLSEMMGRCGPLHPIAAGRRPPGCGPAEVFERPGMRGSVGFIAALSRPFCASCNRLRLSSRGVLQACLDSEEGADLGNALRRGASDDDLARLAVECVSLKRPGHSMCGAGHSTRASRMCAIGG